MHLFALLIGSLLGDHRVYSRALGHAAERTEGLRMEETSIEIIFNFSEGVVCRWIPARYTDILHTQWALH